MRRVALALAFLVLWAAIAVAQETQSLPTPTAGYSQAYCTGFIAENIPDNLFVSGGGDDDFHSGFHQFVKGESVFIAERNNGAVTVGAEYSVVRPAKTLFETTRYQGEAGDIRKLGRPYEDVAQVRVTHVSPAGVVADVTFTCEAVAPGDILVPFQPRAIPDFNVNPTLDHFAPLDQSKVRGKIAASRNNFGLFGDRTVVYLNMGANQGGVQPGKRFRIYKALAPGSSGVLSSKHTPPEIVGEAVILSVQSKSSVAMVVSSYREISAGDMVEEE